MALEFDTFDEWLWQTLGLSITAFRNKLRDFLATLGNPQLSKFHAGVRRHLTAAQKAWSGYDYGQGYLYQSSPSLRFSGRRDTKARLLPILPFVRGATVLDIGCNTGFISLEIARHAQEVTGFDINPYLIEVARDSAHHLGLTNANFLVSSFQSFATNMRFGAVLSLSNHFTYDGDMIPTLEEYLERCRLWLSPGGVFIFESHTPKFEARRNTLEYIRATLDNYFHHQISQFTSTGTALDRKRFLYIGRLPQ